MEASTCSGRRETWKLDSKAGIICSGFVSIAFVIIYLVVGNWDWTFYAFGIHVAALQIIGSVVLIVGAIKAKHRFFLPWMITTVSFLYLMVYAGIMLLANDGVIMFMIMIVPITGYLGFALYGVRKAYCSMRQDKPPAYGDLPDKARVINPI